MLRLNNQIWNNENTVIEDLIIEAVNMFGSDLYYIPRTFVAKDEILGEDRLSTFKHAYPVIMYMENNDNGFAGAGAFASKFGLMFEQQATLTVARKSWKNAVGKYGQTILPERPAEGDLLLFKTPNKNYLLEITFVQDTDSFFQAGQLYVYKLTVETFRYSSETMSTGVDEVDIFNSLKTTGTNDVEAPQSFGDNTKLAKKAAEFTFSTANPFGEVL